MVLDGVETVDGLDSRFQRPRNHRIGGNRHTLDDLPLGADGPISVQLSMECPPDVARGATESEERAAGRDPVDVQSLGAQPAAKRREVLLGEPEAFSHLHWGKPMMVVRRRAVLLLLQKHLQGLFLLWRPRQNQGQLLEWQSGRQYASAVFLLGPLGMVIWQRDHFRGIAVSGYAIDGLSIESGGCDDGGYKKGHGCQERRHSAAHLEG